jgi:hypothetical protein
MPRDSRVQNPSLPGSPLPDNGSCCPAPEVRFHNVGSDHVVRRKRCCQYQDAHDITQYVVQLTSEGLIN